MFLAYLELVNFRNIRKLRLNLTKGITVLWGDNGEGKTNLIESIYALSYGRSLRKCGNSRMIMKDEEESIVKGIVHDGGGELSVSLILRKRGGTIPFTQGKRAARYTDFAGKLKSVSFVPGDIYILFGSPPGRRKMIDQTAAMVKPLHIEILLDFMKCLRQRNRLLTIVREGKAPEAVLNSFDEELCKLAGELSERRREFVKKLSAPLQESFREIEGNGEISIEGSFSFDRDEFKGWRKRDIARGRTNYGPHRDDFTIMIDGKDGRYFASQGIRRILAVSFRLAQAHILFENTGTKPLLLLDDITSEIDPRRRRNMLRLVEHTGFQTILTTTEEKLIAEEFEGNFRSLKIQKGAIV